MALELEEKTRFARSFGKACARAVEPDHHTVEQDGRRAGFRRVACRATYQGRLGEKDDGKHLREVNKAGENNVLLGEDAKATMCKRADVQLKGVEPQESEYQTNRGDMYVDISHPYFNPC